MKKFVISALVGLFATPLFAADPAMTIDQGGCNGTVYFEEKDSITLAEIEAMAPHLMPMPEGALLMRYEPDEIGGQQFMHWSTDREGLQTYCEDVYFRQRVPVSGLWDFKATKVEFQGCPEAMDPTKGLTSQTMIEWSGIYGPESALEKYPMKFSWKKGDGPNGLHFIATANAMPNVPGDVNITYEFKGISHTQIDVSGSVDMNIKAGGMSVQCSGTLEMTGHPVGE